MDGDLGAFVWADDDLFRDDFEVGGVGDSVVDLDFVSSWVFKVDGLLADFAQFAVDHWEILNWVFIAY